MEMGGFCHAVLNKGGIVNNLRGVTLIFSKFR